MSELYQTSSRAADIYLACNFPLHLAPVLHDSPLEPSPIIVLLICTQSAWLPVSKAVKLTAAPTPFSVNTKLLHNAHIRIH